MTLGIFCAALIGAALGLDRSLRRLRVGWGACALWSSIGAIVAADLRPTEMADNRYAWPLVAAAAIVAVGHYLATTTPIGGWARPREPWTAVAAALAFGFAFGFGGRLLVGGLALVVIFALAWRPLIEDPTVTAAAGPSDDQLRLPGGVIAIGRRPEEGRHDDERRQQREEQRESEQFAHAGGAGVA